MTSRQCIYQVVRSIINTVSVLVFLLVYHATFRFDIFAPLIEHHKKQQWDRSSATYAPLRYQRLSSPLAQPQPKPRSLQSCRRLTHWQSTTHISQVLYSFNFPQASTDLSFLAWVPGNKVVDLPTAVAQFYHGQELTWSVMARVNGKTHSLFGVPRPGDNTNPGTFISADFSATHTTFTVTADDVKFVLNFFSPVSPHDYARQSMPFSYLTVSTSSVNNDEMPGVQVYSDMDNSWVGQFGDGDGINLAWNWESIQETTQAATQVFSLSQVGTANYSEEEDMALWGTAAYCTRENGSKLSNRVGNVDEVRNAFAADGKLGGGGDFHPGSVFAYSQDLGQLKGTSNVTFVIGHVRDPLVSYHGADRASYWKSVCKDVNCGCMHALDDLRAADEESRNLDSFIANVDVGGANYSNILALSTRQTFGTFELTIPSDTLDQSSVLAFLKEISR